MRRRWRAEPTCAASAAARLAWARDPAWSPLLAIAVARSTRSAVAARTNEGVEPVEGVGEDCDGAGVAKRASAWPLRRARCTELSAT